MKISGACLALHNRESAGKAAESRDVEYNLVFCIHQIVGMAGNKQIFYRIILRQFLRLGIECGGYYRRCREIVCADIGRHRRVNRSDVRCVFDTA